MNSFVFQPFNLFSYLFFIFDSLYYSIFNLFFTITLLKIFTHLSSHVYFLHFFFRKQIKTVFHMKTSTVPVRWNNLKIPIKTRNERCRSPFVHCLSVLQNVKHLFGIFFVLLLQNLYIYIKRWHIHLKHLIHWHGSYENEEFTSKFDLLV